MPAFSGRRFVRGGGRKFWKRSRASVGPARRHQQVLDRSTVIAKHAALADAEAAALEDDDAAGFEGLGGFVDRLPAGGDAEVGPPRRELFDQSIDAAFEIAPVKRRAHRPGA